MPYSKKPRKGRSSYENPSRSSYRTNRATPGHSAPHQTYNLSSQHAHGGSAVMETSPNRLSILLVILLIFAIVVFGRLVWVQIIDAHAIESGTSQRTVTVDVEPRRGTIYDRNGVVLATTVDAYNLFCHPHEVQDSGSVNALVNALVQACGGDAQEYRDKIEQNTNFVYLVKGVDEDQLKKIKDLKIEGFDYEKTSKRIYPCGAIASQIVGVVNNEGEPLSGLELYYNDILGGTPGKKTTMYSKEGVPVPGATQIEAEVVNGQDIVVSIDIELQERVEKAVLKRTEEVEGETGFGAVMNADTGEILACASVPTFDITDLSKVEEGATNLSGISHHYEPGSVFKAVTMLAALEEGTTTAGQSYYCPSVLEVGKDKITDSHERESMDMTTTKIMADSSNIGMSLIARDLTFSKFYEYLQKYRIVDDTNVDYPGASNGYLAPRDKWTEVQGYNISFGQGLEMSPLQIMRFYGILASNGTYTQPHFLLDVPSDNEEILYPTEKIVDNDKAIDDMDEMLEAVVENGTGTDAAIKGYRVAGKTGTAEVASPTGGYKKDVYNISFVGYLPDASTKLVCFVGATEVPGERKTVSAFQDIMKFAIDRYSITQDQGAL
ncbi:peptidoglycan D,D-transpeptidase FtsI family protein [Anaerotardibacter muris]|uniref:peptidoglycan D,D-transpeptidase FtsI family protein n=1 Tax=Anaerotardibacter muris TaxID=2941505 RepID=UPI00203A821F|nr:penicillin-binding protein 2 [Anaerotardibacter muris]